MVDEKQILDLLFNTFVKMCSYIETNNEIGCRNCPCKEEYILKGKNTEFKYFKPVIENIKKKL